MKILTFLALSFFVQSCGASEDCNNPETQYSMNICSGIKLSKLESKLKNKVEAIGKHLKKIEGELLLLKSNVAWFNFRNLHCESVSHIYESGSIHSFIVSECKIVLTKERIRKLESDYKDTIDTIMKDSSSASK